MTVLGWLLAAVGVFLLAVASGIVADATGRDGAAWWATTLLVGYAALILAFAVGLLT